MTEAADAADQANQLLVKRTEALVQQLSEMFEAVKQEQALCATLAPTRSRPKLIQRLCCARTALQVSLHWKQQRHGSAVLTCCSPAARYFVHFTEHEWPGAAVDL